MFVAPRIIGLRRSGEARAVRWHVELDCGLTLELTTARVFSYRRFHRAALRAGVILEPMPQRDWHFALYQAFKVHIDRNMKAAP